MMRKHFLLILFSLITLAAVHLPAAQACSGYPYFGVEDLPNMQLLVRATVIDADDRGFSAVIRVEDYYKGRGPQLLVVMRYPAALASGAYVRGYDTSCLYSGRGHRWVKGSQGYFGLTSNGNGTFTDEYYGTAHFYPVDGVISYQEGATEGYAVEFDPALTITEDEFVAKLLEIGGRPAPLTPMTDTVQFYPLMRFLDITTENGTRYQVNPNRTLSRLPDDWPLAISPDGAHVAFRDNDSTIGFQYIWTRYEYTAEARARYSTDGDPFEQYMVEGQAVRFSNDSNLAAVWDRDQLSVILFTNYADTGYGMDIGVNMIGQANLSQPKTEPLPLVQWSADSSTLVWQDARGISRWNLIEEARPKVVMSAADLETSDWGFPALLDVSTYGRFVRVGQRDEWILIDALSGERHANLIAAPTEQYLISVHDEVSQEELPTTCKPPLRQNCQAHLSDRYGAQWTFPFQLNFMGIGACPDDQSCWISLAQWHPSMNGEVSRIYGGAQITEFRQIIYDPLYDRPAILVGDYQIDFDFYSSSYFEEESYLPYLDYLDLEDQLDSPIAFIEWGQPVFYDEYLTTTVNWLPR